MFTVKEKKEIINLLAKSLNSKGKKNPEKHIRKELEKSYKKIAKLRELADLEK